MIAGDATCTICGGVGGGTGSTDGANAIADAVIVATPTVKHLRIERPIKTHPACCDPARM
jgi:hypothetical protein